MAGLAENQTFNQLTSAAYSLGKSLPKNKATKQVSVPQYKNLSGVKNDATPVYDKFKNLGAITVPYGGGTKYEGFHPGVDIAAPSGTTVPAFTGGKVTEVRTGVGKTTSPSFGNYVIVTDPSGAKHRYSHLSQEWVKLGDEIKPGQSIGAIGATGSVYSQSGGDPSHLDYRIMDAFNKYIDPSVYLSKK